jgi:hypothetical protein
MRMSRPARQRSVLAMLLVLGTTLAGCAIGLPDTTATEPAPSNGEMAPSS